MKKNYNILIVMLYLIIIIIIACYKVPLNDIDSEVQNNEPTQKYSDDFLQLNANKFYVDNNDRSIFYLASDKLDVNNGFTFAIYGHTFMFGEKKDINIITRFNQTEKFVTTLKGTDNICYSLYRTSFDDIKKKLLEDYGENNKDVNEILNTKNIEVFVSALTVIASASDSKDYLYYYNNPYENWSYYYNLPSMERDWLSLTGQANNFERYFDYPLNLTFQQ